MLDNAVHEAFPPDVHGGDHTGRGVAEQNGRAVGGVYADGDVPVCGDYRVGVESGDELGSLSSMGVV